MMTRLYKKAIIVIVAASALSAFIEPRRLPAGIFLGGALALLNLRGLVRGLENFMDTYRPTARLLFMSIFRLLILAAALFLLIISRVASVLGLMAGFTIVFTLLLAEGLKAAKEGSQGS
jgi:hypothetical protein